MIEIELKNMKAINIIYLKHFQNLLIYVNFFIDVLILFCQKIYTNFILIKKPLGLYRTPKFYTSTSGRHSQSVRKYPTGFV